MLSYSQKVFCAFCKLSRKVYSKKHLTWINVLLSLTASLLFMYIYWQNFNPKFLILFVLFCSFSEVFIQIRWRMAVVCPHCGFDPVLYVRDQKEACTKVKNTLQAKKESGEFLLSTNNPFENLPKISKEDLAAKESGLSRRI